MVCLGRTTAMKKEKLQALEQLVKEQLEAQHTPVFVLKKNSVKLKMIMGFKAVNKVIQPMDPLQPGLPLPSLLPKSWLIIIIGLKMIFSQYPCMRKPGEGLLSQ